VRGCCSHEFHDDVAEEVTLQCQQKVLLIQQGTYEHASLHAP
jgi:hypothetical protein